jgi:hypothetical protein
MTTVPIFLARRPGGGVGTTNTRAGVEDGYGTNPTHEPTENRSCRGSRSNGAQRRANRAVHGVCGIVTLPTVSRELVKPGPPAAT